MIRALAFAAASAAAFQSDLAGPSLVLAPCAAQAAGFQQWTLTPNKTKLVLSSTLASEPMCIDIRNFDTNASAYVYTYTCGSGSKLNEDWAISATEVRSMQTPPTCLAVAGGAVPGATVTTAVCAPGDALQALSYSASTQQLTHVGSGLCVDAGSPQPRVNWCSVPPASGWTICDASAPIEARAADIVSRLSIDDKYKALGTATPALPSINLPAYQWWSEATHGIGGPGVHNGGNLTGALNTALPITTSCSFNRTLWHETGNAIAREGRAFFNRGLAGSTFWTPVRAHAAQELGAKQDTRAALFRAVICAPI